MYIFVHLKNTVLNATLINKVQFCSGLLTKHGTNKLYSSFARMDATKSFRQTNWGVTCTLSSKHKLLERMSLRFKHPDTYLDVNTNIKNNVILYKHVGSTFFTILNVFTVVQSILWSGLAYMTYNPSYKKIFTSFESCIEVVGNDVAMFVLFVTSIIGGPCIVISGHFLCSRSVKYIILHKGGQTLTVITHHPIKSRGTLTVPVKDVKTSYLVSHKKNVIPLKIKGKSLYYLLDINGKFMNDDLFDNTIGIKKDW